MDKKASLWSFGMRKALYGAIGAALYGIFSWTFNIFPLSVTGSVSFHPEVAVLIFFGITYGPWVGLTAGLIGATLGDALSGWGIYWNRSAVGGIIGLVAGLAMMRIKDYRSQRGIATGIGFGALGIAIGMLLYALTEMSIRGADLNTALVRYFTPDFIGNLVVTVVVLPILMWIFPKTVAEQPG